MDGNLEFRVLSAYFAAMFLVPLVFWRKTRVSRAVLGVRGERQRRARLVAGGCFVIPLAIYVIDGPWPWYPNLFIPDVLRWAAAIPATLAILLLTWACRQTDLEAGFGVAELKNRFVEEGPYRSLRHPQLLAASIFFLAVAVMASNGVVLIGTLLGVLLLRLVVAPAVESDLREAFGQEYEDYRQRTGSFFVRLRRIPKAQYSVPRRFGLSAVLSLTTIFAFLFGALNYMRADPVVYLFVATEISAICLVQIFFGSAARSGSALIGAALLPFWAAIAAYSERQRPDTDEMIIVGMFLVVLGALLGYCIGALAAGFFLAMDLLEPYLPGYKPPTANPVPGNSDQPVS